MSVKVQGTNHVAQEGATRSWPGAPLAFEVTARFRIERRVCADLMKPVYWENLAT